MIARPMAPFYAAGMLDCAVFEKEEDIGEKCVD